ncbi:MAG: hypothetical protein ACTTK2_03785 [Hoylesella marshii]|uniref:hypothetical protein n=1 Tax=Hoylesella marshii TaxID=189722 RepID=UPI003FA12009
MLTPLAPSEQKQWFADTAGIQRTETMVCRHRWHPANRNNGLLTSLAPSEQKQWFADIAGTQRTKQRFAGSIPLI